MLTLAALTSVAALFKCLVAFAFFVVKNRAHYLVLSVNVSTAFFPVCYDTLWHDLSDISICQGGERICFCRSDLSACCDS